MSTTIYRIQDADGRGPWKPGFSRHWVELRADHEALQSIDTQFGDLRKLARKGFHYGCGCRTLEQLRRWFTPIEYRRLKWFGYCAVRIDADRILVESDIQCVFQRSRNLREGAEQFDLYE